MKTLKIFVSVLAIAIFELSCEANEIHCNAHINIQQGDSQVSFDKMSLEVYSQSGAKQESSQCTPDGNCFVVIYNNDAFTVRMKGPAGSVFEPSEYKYDAKKGDKCEDIQFRLKGFSLKFAVKQLNQDGNVVVGPQGIKIELRKLSKIVTDPLSTQVTDSQGEVIFDQITIPQTYNLQVSGNDDTTFKEENIDCNFKWESGFQCQRPYFLINGFQIKGTVLSYNEAMPNVKVYLHSGDRQITDKSKDFLKQEETDQKGVYVFKNIPIGSYQIVALYSENQSKFQVEPEVIKVSVESKSVTAQSFSVIGFSIFGRVVNARDQGIGEVKIVIDGQVKATTNDKGVYKLDEITPGEYVLEGISQHYFFDSMNIKINPSSRQIQNLVVQDYHVCGKIQIEGSGDSKGFQISKRTVLLTDKNNAQKKTQTDEHGEFCFDVKTGTYHIIPQVTADEKEKGLRLLPSDKQIVVDHQPVLNVLFTQSKLSVSGKVKCIEQDDQKCKSLKVNLYKQGKLVQTEAITDKGIFKFDRILPAKYQLRVQIEEFCWQQEKYDIEVSEEDIKNLNFEQTGYSMPYESSHTFDVLIKKGKTDSSEKKQIHQGKNNQLCFEQRGSYTITPDSCYKFDKASFTFETGQAERTPVIFKPTHFKVEGVIALKDEKQISKIQMTVQFKGEKQAQEILKLNKGKGNDYTFEYFTTLDNHFTLEPKLIDDSNLLFYPKSKEINIDKECITNIRFEAKTGLVIQGQIIPPTQDVLIKITNKKSKTEVISIKTDDQGKYKVGPLYDDQEYEIDAQKEDYLLKREEGTNNFKAQKLSTLTVIAKDQEQKPLEGVSLSLSAGKGFRLTGSTNQQGIFKFVNLNSGQYYVTSILKEYEFDSASISVNLVDGDHVEKTLKGKRIAFSAYGSIKKLSGMALENARVIAKCEQLDRIEETQADSEGNYRIRGLVPGQKYHLSVIAEGIDRCVPNQLVIDVTTTDSKDNKFLAIMKSPFIEISGSVNFDGEDQKAVFKEDPKALIELYDIENPESPVQTWQLSLSRYFQFSSLPRKEYSIRIVPQRGLSDRRYEATTFKIDDEGGFQSLIVPQRSKGKTQFSRFSLIGPLLFALIVAGIFYQNKILTYLGLDADTQASIKSQKPASGKPASGRPASKNRK